MISQNRPDQQLCDDGKLIAIFNDGDQAVEYQDVIEHIERCSRCQKRFNELAAGAQDWSKARQALLNDDPCSENRVGSTKWDYSLRNEGPVAWTESMARQLLSPASHPELLGCIGRYDVESLIGSGGMGVVFKSHDSELSRPVAIKILAPYLSASGPARKRFAREARAAAAVVHEHVVPIYNVETEREIPFMVMQYIAGESLQRRIDREGALELCEILRIGMQVAYGLSAAHQQGLVHRDIKPSNILMEQGVERALITDFGLARAADDGSLTRTGFHTGTPQYMSPEQAAGEHVDARSDLFSFGSMLYTMCTGRPPFRAETSLGVLRRITDVEPRPIREINPAIPEWLCTLVARLMSKSPDDRFGNALEVAELLRRCLAHVQQPTDSLLPVSIMLQTATLSQSVFKLTRKGVFTMLVFIGMISLGMVLWQATEAPDISCSEWEMKQVFNPAHDQMVWAVAFSPDGQTIASAGADMTLKLWNVANGQRRSTLLRPVNCTDVTYSPNGMYLAIAGGDHGKNARGELVLLRRDDDREKIILESHENARYVKSVAFSPDNKWLASGGSDKTVKIWSVDQRKLHSLSTGHTALVSQVAFSPNGKTLASASFDHTIKLWSVPDGEAIATLRGHEKEVRGIAFSPDSNLLVSVSEDGTARAWNTGSGESLGVMDGHGGPMFSVAFAPDGRHFVTGSRGGSGVMIWDVKTQKSAVPVVLPRQERAIMSLTFSTDGQMLAIAGSWNGFQIWNRKVLADAAVNSIPTKTTD